MHLNLDWRLTIIIWGWHAFQFWLEADNYYLRLTCISILTGGWQSFCEADTSQSDLEADIHFNLDWRLTHLPLDRGLTIILWGWPSQSELVAICTKAFRLSQIGLVSIMDLFETQQFLSDSCQFHGFSDRSYTRLMEIIFYMIHLDSLTMFRSMKSSLLMMPMSHNHHHQIRKRQFQPRYRGPCQNAI